VEANTEQKFVAPVLQRVYVKDLSFESPDVHKALSKPWKPDLKLDMHTHVHRLEAKIFEVTLSLTAKVSNDGAVAYIVEIQQTGIFTVDSSDEALLKKQLGSECPGILFPYARECFSNLVARGGFPQLLLTPVNFTELYNKALANQVAGADIRH